MSKLAKKAIAVPQGVIVEIENRSVSVKGPKGERQIVIPMNIEVAFKDSEVRVSPREGSKQSRANTGTAWSLIKSAISGVTEGFSKTLEIEGVGYKMAVDGQTVTLSLGYVNPVKVPIPAGLTVTAEKNAISISGFDKDLVGRFTSNIRSLKKPEPYKGKGIRYKGEVIRRKAGKKATATTK